MKRRAIVSNETTLQALSKVWAAHRLMGEHLRNAIQALGGVLDESGDIIKGDNTTQQPSRSIYAWMGRTLEKFYLHQDKKRKLDRELATIDPDSKFGRKLKIERELAEIQQDQALDENRRMKSELDERWARKDPCARWPVWRDPTLYAKKNEKEPEKDPWATRRLI